MPYKPLAYRYIKEVYPDQWRFSIGLIENRQHALKIARALSGHARAIQAPMAIFLDVAPTDPDWVELVRQLAHEPYFQILIAIREEDFRRSNISNAFGYEPVSLAFHMSEARLIFARARQANYAQAFLNFEDAWQIFGGKGPLLEFIYLLTQTRTLHQRLEDQIDRIRREVREKNLPNELELLRLVSVAAASDARIHLPSLLDQLHLPDPGFTLNYYEAEYLIKVMPDNQYITGLHPIRSRIISGLLTEPGVYPLVTAIQRSVALIPEDDWEIFFLQSLVEHEAEFEQIMDLCGSMKPTMWTGLAGILRCLIWAGAKLYDEENWDVAVAARDFFGPGWHFILDLNFADKDAPSIEGWWKTLGDLITDDRKKEIERIRKLQTPKERVFAHVKSWFDQQVSSPKSPSTIKEWTSAAEVLYWARRLGRESEVSSWLSDETLDSSIPLLPIANLAEFSYGLYSADPERFSIWHDEQRPNLEIKLAEEMDIIAFEEVNETITVHFLTYPEDEHSQSGEMERIKKSLHERTIEKLNTVRLLFPQHGKYGARGYGHQIPILGLQRHDDTNKTGVAKEHLPPRWPIWLNGIANALIQNRFRPQSWVDYLQDILRIRRAIVSCFNELARGLSQFFRRDKPFDLLAMEIMTNGTWDQTRTLVNERPLLPKLTVDIWGTIQPGSDLQRLASEFANLLPTFVAGQIKPYLERERKYYQGVSSFIEQSPPVMRETFHVGKLPNDSPQKAAILDLLREQYGERDLRFLSFFNLSESNSTLLDYQSSFRSLFMDLLETSEIEELENAEREAINLLWTLWFYYTEFPRTPFADARKQAPARFNAIISGLYRRYDEVLEQFHADRIETEHVWENSPTVWVKLDVDDPISIYQEMESLIFSFRDTLGPIEYGGVSHALIETQFKFTVIVPLVRGKLIAPMVWPLQTVLAIASDKPIEERPWAFVPQPVSNDLLAKLGISCWEHEDIKLAIQLAEAIQAMALISSMMVKVNDIPNPTKPGLERLQEFVGKRSKELSTLLQSYIDAGAALLDRHNRLSEADVARRPNLVEAVHGLQVVHRQVLPSDEFSGQASLSIENLIEYSDRLQIATSQVEGIKLLWIADILATVEPI